MSRWCENLISEDSCFTLRLIYDQEKYKKLRDSKYESGCEIWLKHLGFVWIRKEVELKKLKWICIFYRYIWIKGKWEEKNRRRIIFSCLFVLKSERKEKDNAVKWQFYLYIVIKGISIINIESNKKLVET